MPAARVRIVPLGIDPQIFRARGAVARLPTRKTFKFLFVGAPVLRKGIDILLRAWQLAFRSTDDVCLIIKTNPREIFYEGIDWRERIREQASAGAEIVLLDQLLPAERLGALYRACQASVFPYRAEGFALPILEAMACGCPPIVPRFGACLDYCADRNSHFVQARRINLPVNRTLSFNTLGFEEEIQEVDFCEISVDALADALVRVSRMPSARREAIARRAAKDAMRFTWDHSCEVIERAVSQLSARPTPVRLRRARRLRNAARQLLAEAGAGGQ